MGYDLRYFTRTYNASDKANGSSQAILDKFPYLSNRQALVNALGDSTALSSQRNPNGYTAAEMADIIIDRWDQIMEDTWSNSTTYTPFTWQGAIDAGYRWDQKTFWDWGPCSVIYHDGDGGGQAYQILDKTEIVLLPGEAYEINVKEFKQKPFLGFDRSMQTSEFGAELDVDGNNKVTGLTNANVAAGSFVTGVEYRIGLLGGSTDFTLIGAADNNTGTVFTATGPGTGDGFARETSGTIRDDESNPISPDPHKSLMFVYDYEHYHEDLNENGWDSQYFGSFYSTTGIADSKRYYDLSVAKFSVTVSGGEVTAITAASRLDGNGASVTGGWGYVQADHDYRELQFGVGTLASDEIAPRALYRAQTDQSGYTGNKAEVNILFTNEEFYGGKNLDSGDIAADAYAVYGVGERGVAVDPDGGYSYATANDRLWPQEILPRNVRVISERPVLKTTSRSLKEKRVGTGAQRFAFEFEYPPMTQAECDTLIDAFEIAKGGAKEITVGIPNVAIEHLEHIYYNEPLYKAASFLKVPNGSGTVGSNTVVVDGLEPGENRLGTGVYIKFEGTTKNKIYRVVGSMAADDYGRAQLLIEPPLVETVDGKELRANNTLKARSDFFIVNCLLVDDTLDVSVDAAGHYRMRFKFVEAI